MLTCGHSKVPKSPYYLLKILPQHVLRDGDCIDACCRYAQQMMQYNMLLGPQPQPASTIPPDTPLESRAASYAGMNPDSS